MHQYHWQPLTSHSAAAAAAAAGEVLEDLPCYPFLSACLSQQQREHARRMRPQPPLTHRRTCSTAPLNTARLASTTCCSIATPLSKYSLQTDSLLQRMLHDIHHAFMCSLCCSPRGTHARAVPWCPPDNLCLASSSQAKLSSIHAKLSSIQAKLSSIQSGKQHY
jgi:hypothetical protein